MAKRELKGFEKKASRWVWMINGERVRVTCEELGLPPDQWTQEGSRDAAYEWRQRFIGQRNDKAEASHPHAEQLAVLKERVQIAQHTGLPTEQIQAEIENVKNLPADQTSYLDDDTLQNIKAAELTLGIDLSDADPLVLERFFSKSAVWADRKKRSRIMPVDKMVGTSFKTYIDGIQKESRLGIRSADGADNLRRWLSKFVDFAGEMSAVESIDFDLWERWQRACKARSRKMETEEAAKEYQVAKTFLKWLWKKDSLTILPKNLEDKMGFPRYTKKIVTYDTATVKKTVDLATGRLKLHLLLMCNCGMTQKDISDLRKSQCDLKAGTITRKRSKTELKENTPTVTYQLWESTLALLKEDWSKDPVLALTTKSGQAWLRKETTESGKIKKTDNIATLWANLKKKNANADYLLTLKAFRKSSSTLLRNNKEFAEFYFLYLGHSERTVAGKSYADLSQDVFNQATEWLGRQYGVAKLAKAKKEPAVKTAKCSQNNI